MIREEFTLRTRRKKKTQRRRKGVIVRRLCVGFYD